MSAINPAIRNRKKIWVPKPLYGAGLKKKRKDKLERSRSHRAEKSCELPIKKKKKC